MIRLGYFDRPQGLVRLVASAGIAAGLIATYEIATARAADLETGQYGPCDYPPCGYRSEVYPPPAVYPPQVYAPQVYAPQVYARPEYRPYVYPAPRFVPDRYGYRSYEPADRPHIYADPYDRYRGRYAERDLRPPAAVPEPRRWGAYPREQHEDYALENAPPNYGWREERRERW